MHELSIAQSVVDIAARHAAGRRVQKVEIQVGYLRQVVPSALTFSFELVAQGTVVEGAELDIQTIPAVGLCKACEEETRLEAFPFQCRSCGSFDLKIIAGDELIVESLELEETEHAACSH